MQKGLLRIATSLIRRCGTAAARLSQGVKLCEDFTRLFDELLRSWPESLCRMVFVVSDEVSEVNFQTAQVSALFISCTATGGSW
jgi:hypothetical protein